MWVKRVLLSLFLFQSVSCNLVPTYYDFELIANELCAACPELCTLMKNNTNVFMKMFDATSKLPSGYFEGHVMDFGNFDECMDITLEKDGVIPKYCPLAAILMLKFNLGEIKKNHALEENPFGIEIKGLPLLLSMCLPATCTPLDFKNVSGEIIEGLGLTDVAEITFIDQACSTNEPYSIDKYDIAAFVVFGIIIALLIASTTYDFIMEKRQKKTKLLYTSFSILTNGRKLLSTTRNEEQLLCLNGMRFISMMWVVAGHRFSSAQSIPSINMAFINDWRNQVYSMYIQGAPLAVDTFLWISGLVLSYSFLKAQSRPGSRFNFLDLLIFYLHRYIRLTPVVAALFLFTISIFKYVATGPLWVPMIEALKQPCLKYWWSYFLYVQNYVNLNEMCWLHTWYLSMDMQIFIISPLILLPLLKYRKYANYALYVLVVIFIFIPFIITYVYKTVIFQQDYYDYYYYLTHTRLAPWFIGIWMGAFILDYRNRKFKIHWATNLVIWIAVLCGMGATVFTGNDILNNFEQVKNAIYIALHRSAWSIGLCWIVFACTKGYGGIINWLLSLPMFQVLSRLTYTMYLVHVVFITISIGRMRTAINISDYDMFYTFAGDLTMTTIGAMILTLAFESPVIILEKIIFKKNTPQLPPPTKKSDDNPNEQTTASTAHLVIGGDENNTKF